MNSRDYGLKISGEDTWTRPQPDVKRISVPGRNPARFVFFINNILLTLVLSSTLSVTMSLFLIALSNSNINVTEYDGLSRSGVPWLVP